MSLISVLNFQNFSFSGQAQSLSRAFKLSATQAVVKNKYNPRIQTTCGYQNVGATANFGLYVAKLRVPGIRHACNCESIDCGTVTAIGGL
jgi:hypothetical protein